MSGRSLRSIPIPNIELYNQPQSSTTSQNGNRNQFRLQVRARVIPEVIPLILNIILKVLGLVKDTIVVAVVIICIPVTRLALRAAAVSPPIPLAFLVGGTADVGFVGTAIIRFREAFISTLLLVPVAA